MTKHQELLQDKFPHAKEDLNYNSGGNVMWSLFRTKSGGVTVYYHDTDDFHIINSSKAQHYSLQEIADSWNPFEQKLN